MSLIAINTSSSVNCLFKSFAHFFHWPVCFFPVEFWVFFIYPEYHNNFFFFKEIHVLLFIYLWLCWVFVSVRGLSLVVESGDHSSSRCTGLSPSWPLLLRSTGSRCAGSVIVAHGPSCSVACGIFPDQGLNPCPLHWQADSQPLRHQGSPITTFEYYKTKAKREKEERNKAI